MEEGELNPTLTSAGDELYNALHQRLVASGEWQRLLILLRRMLDECGWETQFQQHAVSKAKQQPVLSVPELIDALGPHARGTSPRFTAKSACLGAQRQSKEHETEVQRYTQRERGY